MLRALSVLVLAALIAGMTLTFASAEKTWSPLVDLRTPRSEDRGRPRVPKAPHGAVLLRRTQLRTRPGGRVIRTLSTKTRWGSMSVLGVVERRDGWIGVLSHHLRNSQVGWIPAGNVRLVHEPYAIHIDVSARSLVVRHRGRVVRRVTIAVGRSGSTTPRGRFAITDLLRFKGAGAYGCCALALTARQRNIPQGWSGGDRIAVHGTPNEAAVGSAVTAGCMRAKQADMRWMLSHIGLGAPVHVRA